jgi:hypothetical protein
LNLHGHSNQHAADIEMISIKMAEIAERPHKIKKSIDLKDHLIQAKTLEIQMKLRELYDLKKKRTGSFKRAATGQVNQIDDPNELRTDTLVTESD